MKRILALFLVCVTCFLCACDEALLFDGTQDDVQDSASENNQSFIRVDGNSRYIIMPISKVEINLESKYHGFIPYITEELLEAAEKDIVAIKGKVVPRDCTFFTTSEGYLHIQVEYIEMVDPEKIANGYEQVPPCGDHRHRGCGGRISSQPLEQFVKKTSPIQNTIKAISDELVKTSEDPIETPTETPPGELPPVEQLRRADVSKLVKDTLYFKEKTEAIIVFLRGNEQRWEWTIVITPEVLMVVNTGFGHPRQFSYLNSVQVNYIKGASIISPEDYKRFKEYKERLDEIAAAVPGAVAPEEDFKGEVFYGYMTADSFDVYDQNTLEKIFADNGYDSSCFDAFEEMYERFGIADIINPPKE